MRIKVILGVAALLVALVAAPASGGPPPTLTVTPTSGPLGTEFFISGNQCFPQEGAGIDGAWVVYPEGSDTGLAAGGAGSSEAGVWEDSIPTDPPPGGPLPGPGTYVVEADCLDDEGLTVEFSYEPATFTVTEDPDITPPLVETTTTTAAAPAVATNAPPTFTG